MFDVPEFDDFDLIHEDDIDMGDEEFFDEDEDDYLFGDEDDFLYQEESYDERFDPMAQGDDWFESDDYYGYDGDDY